MTTQDYNNAALQLKAFSNDMRDYRIKHGVGINKDYSDASNEAMWMDIVTSMCSIGKTTHRLIFDGCINEIIVERGIMRIDSCGGEII